MEDIVKKCSEIAVEAGKIALGYMHGNLSVEIKEDHTPVTQVDKEVNEYILDRLAKIYPDYRLVGEESIQNIKEDLDKGRVFYVDPIDGTKSFIKKEAGWCVIIGLCEDGKPIMGVIYEPFTKTIFWGIKGKGSFKVVDGKDIRLKVKIPSQYPDDVIFVRSLTSPKELVTKIIEKNNITKYETWGSYGTKCCYIADGRASIYINLFSSYWDSCASQLILEEAGGKVYNFETKKEHHYGGTKTKNPITFCVAHPDIFKKYEPELKDLIDGGHQIK